MNILIKYTIIVLVFAKKLTILVSIEATRVKITKKKKKLGPFLSQNMTKTMLTQISSALQLKEPLQTLGKNIFRSNFYLLLGQGI